MNGIRVFISSRMNELSSERDFLHQLIPNLDLGESRLIPWVFEAPDGAPSSSHSIRDVYLEALQRSSLYIGLIGNEYGNWTIDEFNQATRWGIDRQLYIKGRPEQKRDRRLEVFLERWTDVESGVTPMYFDGIDDLSNAIGHSLKAWAIEQVLPRPAAARAQVIVDPEQIPDRAAQLFGRDELVQTMLNDLQSWRPTLICGFAGAGKSAVAAKLCETWLARNKKPVVWLRCGFAREEGLIDAILRSLEREIAHRALRADERRDLLKSLLKQLSVGLVVLDDCWNGESLFSILSAVPAHTPVLVTSRQRYPLEVIHELDALTRHAALELLSKTSGKELADDEDASALCAALSDHAFSIEIAGRALKVQNRSSREYLSRISAAPHNQTAPLGFSERSRQTVKSLLNASLDALTGDQQLAFLAFGAFFASTLTAEMVHQLLHSKVFWGDESLTIPAVGSDGVSYADTAGLLQSLEEHNLVKRMSTHASPLSTISISVRDGNPQAKPGEDLPPVEVYRIHDLAYSFAKSKASGDKRKQALDVTLSTTYFYNASAQVIYDVLRPELENFMGAAAWAASSGHGMYAERLSERLAFPSQLLQSQGLFEHALRLLELAKHSAEMRGDDNSVAQANSVIAGVQLRLGRFDEAKKTGEILLAEAERKHHPGLEMAALSSIAMLHLQVNELDRAEDFCRRALAISRQLSDIRNEAIILENLASILSAAGKCEDATAVLKEALDLHERNSNQSGRASALLQLGHLRLNAEDWTAAANDFEKAAAIATNMGDLPKLAESLRGRGISLRNLGQFQSANELFAAAREHYERLNDHEMASTCEALLGDKGPESRYLFNLGTSLLEKGSLAEAEPALRRAMDLGNADAASNYGALLRRQNRMEEAKDALKTGMSLGSGIAALNLGRTFVQEGHLDEAGVAYLASIKLGVDIAAIELGSVYYRQDRLLEAEDAYRRGVEFGLGEAAYNLGVLLAKSNRVDEAKAAYRQGIALGYGNSASNLGVLLLDEGAEDEALEVLSQGAQLGSALAMTNLGVVHFSRGRNEDAERHWRRAVDSRDPLAARYLGALLKEQGRRGDAEAVLRVGSDLGDRECKELLQSLLAE
jgi:tetratricopeptide (TPR) repeat protein